MNFVYTANSQRSGKSLLAKVAIVPVYGHARVQTMPDSKEEMRKGLDTEALAASPYLLFDDLSGRIDNQALNAFMTARVWSGRVLGSQRQFQVPKVGICFLTGNNLGLSTDIANRSLRCDLYVEEADPQARQVRRVIDDGWLCKPEVRGDICSALWAIVRAWDEAERPVGARVLRGYEQWCSLFGGMVAHAGFGDCLASPPLDAEAGDTEYADMLAVVGQLVEWIGAEGKGREYPFQAVVDAAVACGSFTWLDGKMRRDESDAEYLELSSKHKSAFGRMLSAKYGGRVWTLHVYGNRL